MTDAAPSTARAWWLRLLLSTFIAVAFFAVLVRQIDAIPPDPSVDWWVVPAYMGSLVLYFFTRAGRWYFLVRPLGEVSWRTCMLTALAGIMWIMLLPLRLGELARPLFLAQRTNIRASQALGTVAIERVVDGLMVCGMFFAAIAVVGDTANLGWTYTASIAVTGAFGVALVGLLAMVRWPTALGRLVGMTVGRVLPSLSSKLVGVAHGVAEGLAALPSPRPLVLFLLTTVAYWAVNILGMWVLAVGCGLDLDIAQAAAVMAVVNIVLLTPAAPGQVGNFHAGVVAGLLLFLDDAEVRTRGSVFVFYLYLCQLTGTVLVGLWAQRKLALDWRSVIGLRTPDPRADGVS